MILDMNLTYLGSSRKQGMHLKPMSPVVFRVYTVQFRKYCLNCNVATSSSFFLFSFLVVVVVVAAAVTNMYLSTNPWTSSDHYNSGKQTNISITIIHSMIPGDVESSFLKSMGFSLVLYILTVSDNIAKFRVSLPMFLMPCCSCDSV